jgi:hypothetical protein
MMVCMAILVNYLWMRRNPDASPVAPSHLISNLRANASRYPDHTFYLWVEDPSAQEALNLPSNVQIEDVANVLHGRNIPIMSSNRDSDFWSKVDIARLLVLRRALDKPDCTAAVYADFDIADVRLDAKQLWQRLNLYGVAFGASFCSKDDRQFIVKHFENGYMAFGLGHRFC